MSPVASLTLINQRGPAGTYYYLSDAQRSVMVTTDQTSQLAIRYQYDPYGNQLNAIGLVPNPWRYAGGYRDTQTNLYKFGARFYPRLGQWTQPDPSGQDQNPYTYTTGNPTSRTDPAGKNAISDFFTEDVPDAAEEVSDEFVETFEETAEQVVLDVTTCATGAILGAEFGFAGAAVGCVGLVGYKHYFLSGAA